MCSIQGVAFQNKHTVKSKEARKIVTKLLINGMQRGRTATGVCYISGREMTIVKNKLDAKRFIDTRFYKDSLKKYVTLDNHYSEGDDNNQRLLSILGHCRQKTKGTEENNKNNHPIRCGNVVGIHNGVIINDDTQFEKFKDIFSRNAQVDSEIIFALIDHYSKVLNSIPKGIQKTCTCLSGGYSCAMVHSHQPQILWLFRADSPCTIYHFEESGMIIFASLPGYIIDSVTGNISDTLGSHTEIKLDPCSGIAFDLFRNRYQRFRLEGSLYGESGVY